MLTLYTPEDYKRVLEVALLTASGPLTLAELKRLFEEEFDDDTLPVAGGFAPGRNTRHFSTG